MKKSLGIAILPFLLLLVMIFYGRQDEIRTIANPRSPSTKNAGRIVRLKEIMRIDDKNEDYFFQYPHKMKVTSDGSLFVVDKNQFLKFDRNGNFMGNFFKHGQGPGELQFMENYILQEGSIVIFDRPLSKIMFLTQGGELMSELKLRIPGIDSFLTKYGENYIFFKSTPPETKGVPEIVELAENLISVKPDGESLNHIMAFPRPYMIMKAGNNSFINPWAGLHKCFRDDDTVFISHTPEYMIKLFSLKKKRVLFQFFRDYERVKPNKETKKFVPGGNYGKISIGGAWFEPPVAKYHLDIQKMFQVKDKLWVITSTVDKKKGILVDVFDREGNYVDNFYLSYPEGVEPYSVSSWIKTASDDFIYTIEKGGTEEFFIVKNRIVNSSLRD
ncbi:MAG: 6-bladed beta-propeller [Candidatus Aminicenantes bacterium]|nr:MAG: 6-bladed beta-propeller [Candidatus Aminicenantes bacterium]